MSHEKAVVEVGLTDDQLDALHLYEKSLGTLAYVLAELNIARKVWDEWMLEDAFKAQILRINLTDRLEELAHQQWTKSLTSNTSDGIDQMMQRWISKVNADPLIAGLFGGFGLARTVTKFCGIRERDMLRYIEALFSNPHFEATASSAVTRGRQLRMKAGIQRECVNHLTRPGSAELTLPYAHLDGMAMLVREYIYPEEVALALGMNLNDLIAKLPRTTLRRTLFMFDGREQG